MELIFILCLKINVSGSYTGSPKSSQVSAYSRYSETNSYGWSSTLPGITAYWCLGPCFCCLFTKFYPHNFTPIHGSQDHIMTGQRTHRQALDRSRRFRNISCWYREHFSALFTTNPIHIHSSPLNPLFKPSLNIRTPAPKSQATAHRSIGPK